MAASDGTRGLAVAGVRVASRSTRVRERVADLGDEMDRLARCEWALPAQQRGDVDAVDELHDDEVARVGPKLDQPLVTTSCASAEAVAA